MANSLVEPNANAAAAAPAVEPTTPEATGTDLPQELLQIPAFQGIIAGEPAAFSVPIAGFENSPEGKLITANKDPLLKAGMGFYRSLGGDIGAIFNRMFLADTEIQTADKEGRLTEVAPPLSEVNQMISQSGQANPVLQDKPRPTGLKSAGPAAPAPGPTVPPNQLANKSPARAIQAKMRNLDVGSPTEGAKPGAGRVLNQILKPVL